MTQDFFILDGAKIKNTSIFLKNFPTDNLEYKITYLKQEEKNKSNQFIDRRSIESVTKDKVSGKFLTIRSTKEGIYEFFLRNDDNTIRINKDSHEFAQIDFSSSIDTIQAFCDIEYSLIMYNEKLQFDELNKFLKQNVEFKELFNTFMNMLNKYKEEFKDDFVFNLNKETLIPVQDEINKMAYDLETKLEDIKKGKSDPPKTVLYDLKNIGSVRSYIAELTKYVDDLEMNPYITVISRVIKNTIIEMKDSIRKTIFGLMEKEYDGYNLDKIMEKIAERDSDLSASRLMYNFDEINDEVKSIIELHQVIKK